MVAFLLGCRGAVADVERPWWGDAAALERAEAIDLVDLRSGDPLGYWPRVVIRPDRIAIDDRAPILALDADPRPAVVERTFPIDPGDGPLPSVEEALREVQAGLAAADRPDLPLVLVPDARVAGDLLARVVLTATSVFDRYTLAGVAGGRLRAAFVADPPCGAALALEVHAGAAVVRTPSGPLAGDDGACPAPVAVAVETARALALACAPAWAAAEPVPRAADPRSELLSHLARRPTLADPAARCFDATVALGPGATAADLLGALGELHPGGSVRAGPLARGGDPDCAGARRVADLDADALGRICAAPPGPWGEP